MSHKIRATVLLFLLLSLALGGLGPVTGQEAERPYALPASGPEFKAGEVLVKLSDSASMAAAQEMRSRYGATYVRSLLGGGVELWQVTLGRELEVAAQLELDQAVEFAEPNWRAYALGTPNDPLYPAQWAHPTIQSPQGWDLSTGSADVVIAIIDTGIDAGHPDLAAKIVAGYDFVGNDTDPHDLNGHGTHCAGIAAAVTDNGTGVAGLNWQARIMPVRVLDREGSGWMSDIVDGIYWAYQHGAQVLSLSLGGQGYSSALQNAVTAAHDNGSLVVAAMGNDREDGNPTSYPAANEDVMAVAATTRTDSYAFYSQFGSHCDIAAPGGEISYLGDPDGILSTLPTDNNFYLRTRYGFDRNYDYLQGTSMATPYVAGLAALIWAQAPSLAPDEVQQTIQDTADDLGLAGWDPDFGWGRINVWAALQVHAVPPTPTLLPIANPDGDGDYLVDWSDAPNALAYELEEDDSPAFASPTVRYSGPNSQAPIQGQAAGTWYYRVLATGLGGSSAWSNVEQVMVKPRAPLLAPISNASQQDEYLVSWSVVAAATSYTLEEDDDPAFGSPTIRYVGPSPEYPVTGQAGGTWYYRVYAASAAGISPASNVESTTVAPPALGVPVLAAIDNGDKDAAYRVDWSDVSGATSYRLEQSTSPYFEAPTEVYSDAASQFDVVGQALGTWYYRVRALGSGTDRGPWSNGERVVVPAWNYLPLVLR